MTRLSDFISSTLADRRIGDEETAEIAERLHANDRLDLDDVKLLVELYCNADDRCEAFDELFFTTLEQVLLRDGTIDPSEQFYLLKMIYSDRAIRPRERDFLRQLQKNAVWPSKEFDALVKTALEAPDADWCVGGQATTRRR